MRRWFKTNRFLRQALEEAHGELTINSFHIERLEHHLDVATKQRCPMCEELDRERLLLVDHCDVLQRDNARLEWECEQWRTYWTMSVPPMPGLDA